MEQDSKRAFLAVVLSGIVLIGWQYLFPTNISVPAKKVDTKTTIDQSTTITDNSQNKNVLKSVNSKEETQHIQPIRLQSNSHYYVLDNYLNIIETKSLNTENIYPKHFETSKSELFVTIKGNELKPFFNFTKIDDTNFSIVSSDELFSGNITLSDEGVLIVSINSQLEFDYKFIEYAKAIEESAQKFTQFSFLSKDLENFKVGEDENYDALLLKWFGLDFDYHFEGIVLEDPSLHKVKAIAIKDPKTEDAIAGKLVVSSIKKVRSLKYRNVFLQKNYDDLKALGFNLDLAVDFGMMAIVALPILRGLQTLYEWIPNYGIAIILLTIFIRMLTFPLQYKSFKSMKKMQVIQPELTKIREKYKDNPQKMQQETMALFKKAGANPLGGCLPLILQMPIFFAFYQVLNTSVELVDAEFMLWIIDLSKKDPYYILPVLMSLAMFLNMKLTPTTTTDPAQQKIMMFMPLFFGFIMKDLPAGLTLYIFISTIMGMLQQLFVYKRVS